MISEKTENPEETFMPDFVDVFKKAGVEVVHLAEFHSWLGLHYSRLDECARLSDDDFLLLPGEEPNVHLGGHWISFFPRPVM